jgi:subtilisin-like proprotein convertase family protein
MLRWRVLGSMVAVWLAAWPVTAWAATPAGTLQVDGALTAASGGPAADGDYALTFSLYATSTGGAPVWQEGPLVLTVAGGRFRSALGAKVALPVDALAPQGVAAERWLGVQVGNDPELARAPLRAVAFARSAEVAQALACSGCITATQLDPNVLKDFAKASDLAAYLKSSDADGFAKTAGLAKVATSGSYADLAGSPDLGVYAKTAGLAKVATSGSYADLAGTPDLGVYVKASGLANVATTGSYTDLANLPKLAKLGTACGTGLVVQGLAADGSLQCVKGADGSSLPADGLAAVSNGLLTNQFTDKVASAAPVPLLDNNPTGVSDAIMVPDLGTAQAFSVTLDIANSDISTLKVTLFDPTNAAYVLFDGGGKGNALKGSWPSPDKTVSGDLGAWVGKNPKGKWLLQVVDLGFLNNAKDGQINSWSVNIGTLSSKKVRSNGVFDAAGGFKYPVFDADPVACDASQMGYTYLNSKSNALLICNGTYYFPMTLTYVGIQSNPGLTCKDILTKNPYGKSAYYWVDPDGAAGATQAFQVWCDMDTDGGGWTRGVFLATGDKSGCDSGKAWQTILLLTKTWGSGGQILSKYFSQPKGSSDGVTPATVVKFNAAPYGSINAMFSFTDQSNSWAYSASSAFTLTNLSGSSYSNYVWWNYGIGLNQKCNFCLGSNPDHHACVCQGTVHNQCGNIYHNGSWGNPGAVEFFVKEP